MLLGGMPTLSYEKDCVFAIILVLAKNNQLFTSGSRAAHIMLALHCFNDDRGGFVHL